MIVLNNKLYEIKEIISLFYDPVVNNVIKLIACLAISVSSCFAIPSVKRRMSCGRNKY